MAKYDVYEYREGRGLLLDVQADLLDDLNTRVVVPLMLHNEAPTPARRLNPVFEVKGNRYVMVTQYMAAVSNADLGVVHGNLKHHFDEITSALDMVFQGF